MVRRVACVFFCHRRTRCVTYLSCVDAEPAATPFLLRPLPAFKLRKIPEQTSDGMSGSLFLQRLVLRSGRMLQGLDLGGVGRPLATCLVRLRGSEHQSKRQRNALWEQLRLSYLQAGPPPESTGAPKAWRALPWRQLFLRWGRPDTLLPGPWVVSTARAASNKEI